MKLTPDNFYTVLVNHFHVPTDLVTGAQNKPFVIFSVGGKLGIVNAKGKRRYPDKKGTAAFFEKYQRTGSLAPAEYSEETRNASYLLAALAYIQQKD